MKLEPIDTSTTAGKARVMQLAAEGRKVMYLGRSSAYRDGIWNLASSPTWDWYRFDFAIIAEPVGPDEVWAKIDDSGYPVVGSTREIVENWVRNQGGTVVRYRRVEE